MQGNVVVPSRGASSPCIRMASPLGHTNGEVLLMPEGDCSSIMYTPSSSCARPTPVGDSNNSTTSATHHFAVFKGHHPRSSSPFLSCSTTPRSATDSAAITTLSSSRHSDARNDALMLPGGSPFVAAEGPVDMDRGASEQRGRDAAPLPTLEALTPARALEDHLHEVQSHTSSSGSSSDVDASTPEEEVVARRHAEPQLPSDPSQQAKQGDVNNGTRRGLAAVRRAALLSAGGGGGARPQRAVSAECLASSAASQHRHVQRIRASSASIAPPPPPLVKRQRSHVVVPPCDVMTAAVPDDAADPPQCAVPDEHLALPSSESSEAAASTAAFYRSNSVAVIVAGAKTVAEGEQTHSFAHARQVRLTPCGGMTRSNVSARPVISRHSSVVRRGGGYASNVTRDSRTPTLPVSSRSVVSEMSRWHQEEPTMTEPMPSQRELEDEDGDVDDDEIDEPCPEVGTFSPEPFVAAYSSRLLHGGALPLFSASVVDSHFERSVFSRQVSAQSSSTSHCACAAHPQAAYQRHRQYHHHQQQQQQQQQQRYAYAGSNGDVAAALQLLSLPLPFRSSYPTPIARCLGFTPTAATTALVSHVPIAPSAQQVNVPISPTAATTVAMPSAAVPMLPRDDGKCGDAVSPPRRQRYDEMGDSEVVIVPAIENIFMLSPPPANFIQPSSSMSPPPLPRSASLCASPAAPVVPRAFSDDQQTMLHQQDDQENRPISLPVVVVPHVSLKELLRRPVTLKKVQGATTSTAILPFVQERQLVPSVSGNHVGLVSWPSLGCDPAGPSIVPSIATSHVHTGSSSSRSVSPCIVSRHHHLQHESDGAPSQSVRGRSTSPTMLSLATPAVSLARSTSAPLRQFDEDGNIYARSARGVPPGRRTISPMMVGHQYERSSSSCSNPCLVRSAPSTVFVANTTVAQQTTVQAPHPVRAVGADVRHRRSDDCSVYHSRSVSPAVMASSRGGASAAAFQHDHGSNVTVLNEQAPASQDALLDRATTWGRQGLGTNTPPPAAVPLHQRHTTNVTSERVTETIRGTHAQLPSPSTRGRDATTSQAKCSSTGEYYLATSSAAVNNNENALLSTPPPKPRQVAPPKPAAAPSFDIRHWATEVHLREDYVDGFALGSAVEVSPATPLDARVHKQANKQRIDLKDEHDASRPSAPLPFAQQRPTAPTANLSDRIVASSRRSTRVGGSGAEGKRETMSLQPKRELVEPTVAKQLVLYEDDMQNINAVVEPAHHPQLMAPTSLMFDAVSTPPSSSATAARVPGVTPYVELLKKASRELHDLRTQRDHLMHLVTRLSAAAQ